MSLQPALFDNTGTLQGVHALIADLSRRMSSLEAARGSITSLSGGVLAPGSVTGTQVAVGTFTAEHIAAGSITAAHIQAGAITADLISAGAINAGHIQAGSIQSTHIAADQINAGHIQADSIGASEIVAASITATEIAAGTITAQQIAAGTITAFEIAAGTITATNIAAGTITATNIAAGTITGTLIASNAITGDHIVTGSVTATKISVSNLAAVSAQTGTLTVDKIRTASSGARIEYGTGIVTTEGTFTGLAGIDASNAITFLINAATGAAEFKGTIKSGSTGLGNIAGSIDGGTKIDPATITGDRLVIDAITAREIAASAVTATEILANTITGGKIAAGTITAANIAAGTITASELTVAPGGNNLVRNSTFQDGVGVGFGWTFANAALTTTAASGAMLRNGPKLLVATANGAGVVFISNNTTFTADGTTAITNKAPVVAGESVIASCWAGRNGATARSARVRVLFYDEADANIAGGGYSADVPLIQGSASKIVSGPWVVPAGATRARFLWYPCGPSTTPANGEIFYMSGPKLEVGDIATEFEPYFDPTTIDGSGIFSPRIIAGTVGGNRVELTSAGIKQYQGASTVTVNIPSDGTTAVFTANLQARGIDFPYNSGGNSAARWMNGASVMGQITAISGTINGATGSIMNVDAMRGAGSVSSLNLTCAGTTYSPFIGLVANSAVGAYDILVGARECHFQGNIRAETGHVRAATIIGAGGGAPGINTYQGHKFKTSWTGTQLLFYIDETNVKTFVIDHPQEPENKYLIHATLEGPENGVYYRGEGEVPAAEANLEAGLIHRGMAVITLPSYFESLTDPEDRTVLVTPIVENTNDPINGLAASRVENGKFWVTCEQQSHGPQKFYWEVKAKRKDVPALNVEPAKSEVTVEGQGPYKWYNPN